ncbi:hypothetical protein BD779DRAFT_703398 [Infundibulicybe gibba]|nr:hypothetical protein BD779DRAFT_703398 [Infundibulicybe gibba]
MDRSCSRTGLFTVRMCFSILKWKQICGKRVHNYWRYDTPTFLSVHVRWRHWMVSSKVGVYS